MDLLAERQKLYKFLAETVSFSATTGIIETCPGIPRQVFFTILINPVGG